MTSDLQSLLQTLEPAAAEMLGEPVYIIAASGLPEPWKTAGKRSLAFTGSHLDLSLREHLRWAGRGAAILLGDEAIGEHAAALAGGRPGANRSRLLRIELAAVIAHEIAHIAAAGWRFDDLPDAAAELVSAASEAWAAAELQERFDELGKRLEPVSARLEAV